MLTWTSPPAGGHLLLLARINVVVCMFFKSLPSLVVSEWDGLAEKSGVLKTRFLVHDNITGKSKDGMVAQFFGGV